MLGRYWGIVTASDHMRAEYIRHGFPEDRIRTIPFPLATMSETPANDAEPGSPRTDDRLRPRNATNSLRNAPGGVRRLLFVGRMNRLKGGSVLLEALPLVADALKCPVHATFVGDGPERAAWTSVARRITDDHPLVSTTFTGWQDRAAVTEWYSQSDLLVVPSLWPEPFGLVGPEAGSHGLPAVAFDVGGVRQWLHPGVSGILAPGDPPTARGLAAAIVAGMSDEELWGRLSEGARRVAGTFTAERHRVALTSVLREASMSSRPG